MRIVHNVLDAILSRKYPAILVATRAGQAPPLQDGLFGMFWTPH